MYENIKTLPDIKDESVDASKKFTNIDKESFTFTWDGRPLGGAFSGKTEIEPGETVSMAKYLVNYAAMHLAKKIVKREAYEKAEKKGLSPNDQLGVKVKIRDEEREKKLREEMVASNFEQPKEVKK